MEMQLLLALLVRNFSIELATPHQDVQPVTSVTLRPKEAMMLRIVPLSA